MVARGDPRVLLFGADSRGDLCNHTGDNSRMVSHHATRPGRSFADSRNLLAGQEQLDHPEKRDRQSSLAGGGDLLPGPFLFLNCEGPAGCPERRGPGPAPPPPRPAASTAPRAGAAGGLSRRPGG